MMSFSPAPLNRFDARGPLLAAAKYGPRRALHWRIPVDDWKAVQNLTRHSSIKRNPAIEHSIIQLYFLQDDISGLISRERAGSDY